MTVLDPRGMRVVADPDRPGFLKTVPCEHEDSNPCFNCSQWKRLDESREVR